ncbi:DNA repair protein RadC [bacterium]|nr:DNA repair protein RadC [bacterium]
MTNDTWTAYCAEASANLTQRLHGRQFASMSDAELSAILLSHPRFAKASVDKFLKRLDNFKAEELVKHSFEELMQRFQLNSPQTLTLAIALELGKRATSIRYMSLTTPDSAMCYLNDMGTLTKEHFRVLCLDTKKRLLKMDTISIGDLSSSIAHPREVFYPAVQNLADSIIIAHNHPSGDPSPSEADIKLTDRLRQAGDLLGIKVTDHIIIGAGCYVSLRREGLISA